MKTPDHPTPTINAGSRGADAVEASITVEAALSRVYGQWLQVEDFPKFIHTIQSARMLDKNHFAVSAAWDGQPYEAVLQIMLRVPERRVAWRVLHEHLMAGVVSFVSHSEHRTQVTLKMTSSFGGALSHRVEDYLQQFKTLIEAQEIAAQTREAIPPPLKQSP